MGNGTLLACRQGGREGRREVEEEEEDMRGGQGEDIVSDT